MSTEWWLAGLRIAVILIIYLFVLQIGLVLWRDLRRDGSISDTYDVIVEGHLRVLRPGQTDYSTGEIIRLTVSNTFGRSGDNTIRLKDDFVSAKHALLAYRRKGWWLKDLKSTNGTFVNQKPVGSETALAFGDVIEIGNVKLRLERPQARA